MKILTTAAIALLLAGNANAYNILIDFQDSPLDGDFTPGPEPIESRGFNFSGLTEKGVTDWPLDAANASKALHWCAETSLCSSPDSITMTQDGLVAFDLLSLELAVLNHGVDFALTGYFAGGGVISTTVFVSSETLTIFELGGGWTNLQSLSGEAITCSITSVQKMLSA